jgi:hypothetical protein
VPSHKKLTYRSTSQLIIFTRILFLRLLECSLIPLASKTAGSDWDSRISCPRPIAEEVKVKLAEMGTGEDATM